MVRILSCLFVFLFHCVYLFGNEHSVYFGADSVVYSNYINKFKDKGNVAVNELLMYTAEYFLDKPYVASTLEILGPERPVINLREFDCTTFVESCIALSLTIKSGNTDFENYCNILQSIRYRRGVVNGYTSRLHYTSDWIYENSKQGIFNDISKEIGGKLVEKNINFMTSHPQAYKQLKDNKENCESMRQIEDSINARNMYIVLPKNDIGEAMKDIQDGDIIAFATSVSGLDYSHIGIAYWERGALYFIHASSKQKKIVIDRNTLSGYCLNSKSCTGISVVRLNEKY